MPLFAPLVCAVAVCPVVCVPTAFWQSAPVSTEPGCAPVRFRDRAVLLVHGLQPHPFRPSRAAEPTPRKWQLPEAELVRLLAADSDVYGFSYAQTVPVDAISGCKGLREAVESLRSAGYTEVVLVGHSAGGLIARRFAERMPESGVKKVLMVAAPHAGAKLADIRVGIPAVQAPFVRSLSPKTRVETVCRPCPDGIEFACVVCKMPRLAGDAVVSAESQWPEELQRLGIPAAVVPVGHLDAMKDRRSVEKIAELVRVDIPRWNTSQVAEIRKVLFKGDKK